METRLEQHMWTVHVTVRYGMRTFNPADYDEIRSDAALGLVEADRKYDPIRGVKFSTFALTTMRQRVIDGWRTRHGRYTSSAKRQSRYQWSLDVVLPDSTGIVTTYADTLESEDADRFRQIEDRSECAWLLSMLPARDARWLWEVEALGMRQCDIAARDSYTAGRVSQVLDRARERIREAAASFV